MSATLISSSVKFHTPTTPYKEVAWLSASWILVQMKIRIRSWSEVQFDRRFCQCSQVRPVVYELANECAVQFVHLILTV